MSIIGGEQKDTFSWRDHFLWLSKHLGIAKDQAERNDVRVLGKRILCYWFWFEHQNKKLCCWNTYVFLLLWYLDSHCVQDLGHCMYTMERQCLLCSLVGVWLQVTQAKSTISPVVSMGITRGSASVDINRQNIFVCIDPYIHTQP